MSGLSEQQLADIAAREAAATPGPWCTDAWEIYQGAEYVAGAMWIGETCRGGTTTLEQDRADAAFVAAARTDVPALLAEVERLRAQPAVACAVCEGQVRWIYCPTGGWWAHAVHPADGHDAQPIPAAALTEDGEDR